MIISLTLSAFRSAPGKVLVPGAVQRRCAVRAVRGVLLRFLCDIKGAVAALGRFLFFFLSRTRLLPAPVVVETTRNIYDLIGPAKVSDLNNTIQCTTIQQEQLFSPFP